MKKWVILLLLVSFCLGSYLKISINYKLNQGIQLSDEYLCKNTCIQSVVDLPIPLGLGIFLLGWSHLLIEWMQRNIIHSQRKFPIQVLLFRLLGLVFLVTTPISFANSCICLPLFKFLLGN